MNKQREELARLADLYGVKARWWDRSRTIRRRILGAIEDSQRKAAAPTMDRVRRAVEAWGRQGRPGGLERLEELVARELPAVPPRVVAAELCGDRVEIAVAVAGRCAPERVEVTLS